MQISQMFKEQQQQQQHTSTLQVTNSEKQMFESRNQEVGRLERDRYDSKSTTKTLLNTHSPRTSYDTSRNFQTHNNNNNTSTSEQLLFPEDALTNTQLMLGTHYNYIDKNAEQGNAVVTLQRSESSLSTKANWKAVAATFRIAEPSNIAPFAETVDVLRTVAMKWVRLGLHMMDSCAVNKDGFLFFMLSLTVVHVSLQHSVSYLTHRFRSIHGSGAGTAHRVD